MRAIQGRHRKRIIALLVAACAAVTGCGSDYTGNVEPGPHGEPGSDLTRTYAKSFVVRRADYFTALSAFYGFAQEHGFDSVTAEDCFSDALDSVRQRIRKPCRALWTATGAPTKAHMTFSIETQYVDQLRYAIAIFVHGGYEPFEGLADDFTERVEPALLRLNDAVATHERARAAFNECREGLSRALADCQATCPAPANNAAGRCLKACNAQVAARLEECNDAWPRSFERTVTIPVR